MDPSLAFHWIGAILVNLAFISIVTLAAEYSYPVGFVVALIYTAILFKVAQFSEGKERSQPLVELQDLDSNQDGSDMGVVGTSTSSNATRGRNALSGFFYGLGVLALAATGSLLVMSFLEDCGDDDDDFHGQCFRILGIGNIFATAIPVILVSVYLWTKKSVAPCGFTTYLGVGMLGFSIYLILDPVNGSSGTFLKWWSLTTSVIWILGLSYLSIVSRSEESQAPISWGLNIGALVFYSVMFDIVDLSSDGVGNWIMINVFSFLPLIFVGLLTDRNFIVFLGASGLLIDAWRVCRDWEIIMQFVFLAISGLGVMFLGSWLTKNQDMLRAPVLSRVSGGSISGSDGGGYMSSNLEEGLQDDAKKSSKSSTVFGWIGAIIVNTAFISIVIVSAERSFLGGFIACSIYTILLLVLAQRLDRHLPTDEEWNDNGDSNQSSGQYKSLAGFFYGLSVLALAVAGFLLVMSFPGEDIQIQAIGIIFAAAIPVILVSVYLWTKKSVAPCGFTTYLGVGILGLSIAGIVGDGVNGEIFLKCWFLITSVIWILGLSYLSIVSRSEESQAPISWGLNTGALVFYSVMFIVVELWEDGFGHWIVINVFSFLPLIFVGLLTDRNFIVFLGASGLLIDAWRVCRDWEIIIQFVFLAISGLGVMFLGSWLTKNQDMLRAPVLSRVSGRSSSVNDNVEHVNAPTEDGSVSSNNPDSKYNLMS